MTAEQQKTSRRCNGCKNNQADLEFHKAGHAQRDIYLCLDCSTRTEYAGKMWLAEQVIVLR